MAVARRNYRPTLLIFPGDSAGGSLKALNPTTGPLATGTLSNCSKNRLWSATVLFRSTGLTVPVADRPIFLVLAYCARSFLITMKVLAVAFVTRSGVLKSA
jgi:hypothetical protein